MTTEQEVRVNDLIEALESGEYLQGTDALRSGDRFCCLGVACERSGLGAWEEESKCYTTYAVVDEDRVYRNDCVLPSPVRAYYGFRSVAGAFPTTIDGERFDESLVGLNDDRGKTFKEIAAVLRARPEGLFQ